MSLLLVGAFAGVGLAFAVMNLAMTLRAYSALPRDVPYHFDGYGNPDSYCARPVIFTMPLVTILILGSWTAAMIASAATPAAICATGAFFDFVGIALYYMQRGTINVALGKTRRMHPFAFWKNWPGAHTARAIRLSRVQASVCVLRQMFAAAVDVERQHRHRRAERFGFAPRAFFGGALERARNGSSASVRSMTFTS